ncbi:hypothetical protein Taro_019168 [Colocasia esculenta]|uniref:Uncharacterized protein n=1 Tax=Colocasia esculenta TaxID=4460 RepID=A0A843V1A5_COLES|nr:hypothetical protein [Colocasia esculenta]
MGTLRHGTVDIFRLPSAPVMLSFPLVTGTPSRLGIWCRGGEFTMKQSSSGRKKIFPPFLKSKSTEKTSLKSKTSMAVSMKDLDFAFQGAGQKAYPFLKRIALL